MNSVAPAPCIDQIQPVARGLGSGATFYLMASITVSFLAASIAPSPLYPTYQAEWGLSSTDVTLVFGVYAVAVLVSLLTLGRLSDDLGRRPVLLASIAVQLGSMVLFGTAGSVASLLVGRIVQGLATGAAIAAVGAGMLDIDKTRGTTANAITPPIGTALGGIIGGLIAQYLPAPTHSVYAIFSLVFLAQAMGVLVMADPVRVRPVQWSSLRPQLRVPAEVRAAMLAAAPVLIAAWALAGFYGSLGPTLVRGLLGSNASMMSGLAMFILAGSAAATVLTLRARPQELLMLYGASALAVGVAMTILAIVESMPFLYFLGTAVAGSGFGAGFQGSVRTVMAGAAPQDRAAVISVVFVIAYLAMGVPAIGAGYLVTHHGGIFATSEEFGSVLMVLAGVSLLATWRMRQAASGNGQR
jgi:MFS family permease